MKSRSLLILVLVLSLAVVPSLQLALGAASSSSSSSSSTTTTTTSTAAASSPFTQRLDIYLAGSNSYWLVSVNPVNASRPSIAAAESVSGVSAYELTAIEGSTSVVGSTLFFSQGYNVAKLPTLPYSGVFLNVTASSQSAAQTAASDFNSLFGADFVQTGSGGGNYTFFAQAGFPIAGGVLYSTVPLGDKGLATVTNESSWMADPTPTAILTGVRSGSSFTHTVRFGATETGAVGTNDSLLLEDALALQNDSFVTSPNATSTQVVVHSFDGLIQSKDNATVTNDEADFTGTYSISLPDNTRFRPNVTVLQNPPVATATRSVDTGSAISGGIVTVTVNVVNTAYNGTLQNVTLNDNWWTSYPSLFSLSAGNSSMNFGSISPEQNVSRAYSLKVASSASENLIIPAAKVSYSYVTGGLTVNESTYTNQVELRTNNAGPALEVHAGVSILSGSSLGKPGRYQVTVLNTGNDPALNVNYQNYTDPTLTAGSSWEFNMSLPLASISDRNLTQTFTVGWTAPDGSTGTLASNPAAIVLSHTTMDLPLEEFKLTSNTTSQAIAQGSISATWVLTNKGSAVADHVNVTEAFPAGMTCAKVTSANGTCGSSGFTVAASSVAVLGNLTGSFILNFTHDDFLTTPALVTATQAGGLKILTLGSTLPLAGGLTVTKSFSPNMLFEGQDSSATARVENSGSLPIYNVTLSTAADTFDSAVSGSLNGQYPLLNPSASQSLNYTVKMTVPGNHTSASTTISFVFGGFSQEYPVTTGTVLVYKPIEATTSTPTSPQEGADFALAVSVQNPSPSNVTNVSVTLPLPNGMSAVNSSAGFQVSGRTITLTLPSLAGGATSTHALELKPSLDGSFSISGAKLTFQYLGNTLNGVVSSPAITVGVGSLLKFELSIGAAVLLIILVAVYMHRKMVVPAK